MTCLINTLTWISILGLSIHLYTSSPLIDDSDLDLDYNWLPSAANNSHHTLKTTNNHPYSLVSSSSNNRLISTTNQTLSERNKAIVLLVRNQLKKELRKLKSSITDSILEEVINYYGKKLEVADVLKTEMDTLTKRVALLSQNLNTLGQNFKTISKNHRNLVDIVRTNMLSAKKNEAAVAKANSAAVNNNNNNLKKKSIDSSKMAVGLATTAAVVTNVSAEKEKMESKLKQELINDLETKYSHLLNGKLVEIIVKNVRNETMVGGGEDGIRVGKVMSEAVAGKRVEDSKFAADEILSTDCQDLKNEGFNNNGIYKITVAGNKSFNVYCEFKDKIGWTLLQRRYDGSVDFYQNWNTYKNGFGNLMSDGEFWLGLENMHALTGQRNYSLQIVLTDWKDDEYMAEYSLFKIDSESAKYKLELGEYMANSSTAGDSLGDSSSSGQSHNNLPFSTFDSDNDLRFYDNCAQIFKSGWWFNGCFQSNLNGIYYKYSPQTASNTKPRLVKKEENAQLKFLRNGIHWNSIDFYKSLKSTKLRIRRRE